MELSRQDQDGISIVSVQGEIDGASAPQLEEFIVAILDESNLILLNVSEVGYMSSAGFRALMGIYRKVQEVNGQIVIGGVVQDIRDAMNATGFLKHFVLVDDYDEGVRTLTAS